MFRWGIIFLVIALIAAALGFGGLAGTAAGAAKIVFVVGIYSVPGEFVHGPKTTLDFRPLRKFYPKPVQRTGFCGFSE